MTKLNKRYVLPLIFTVFCIGLLLSLTPAITDRPWDEILNKSLGTFTSSQSTELELISSSKSIKDHKFELIYQSARKRLNILNAGAEPSNKEIAEAEKIICYELRISSDKQPDLLKEPNPRPFEERVKYFSSTIQNNIRMIIGKDTLPCAMIQLERNFGVAPYLSIQTAFPAVNNWKKLPHHLILNDEYFGLGEIHLENKLSDTDL
jgi:hypothetical protein